MKSKQSIQQTRVMALSYGPERGSISKRDLMNTFESAHDMNSSGPKSAVTDSERPPTVQLSTSPYLAHLAINANRASNAYSAYKGVSHN